MRVHFIAIGGSAMHNLALALHHKGFEVTGSDDHIFEPSKSRLEAQGLLPESYGWYPEKITPELDAVILGMHAREDNPELLAALDQSIPIYSYPEYLYTQSEEKVRVVIGGSHGKTTITSMVMHVLRYFERDFDYMVGAQLDGFDTMVRLTKGAPIIILEGDEYLSSPIDRRPKFLWYKPHVALISGIAWDHINVFPTYANYVEQFSKFIESIKPDGKLIYCEVDPEVKRLADASPKNIHALPYGTPEHLIENGTTTLKTPEGNIPLKIFGQHNLQNLNGARLVCNELNISDAQFYEAISGFTGAGKRLERIAEGNNTLVFKDFAHSPSKLKATTAAVKAQYPSSTVIAVMELHTFSSLNSEFLDLYAGAMNAADTAMVYFNPDTIARKKLDPISIEQVKEAFKREDLLVRTDSEKLVNYLKGLDHENTVFLLMTSGNFDGVDLNLLGKDLVANS